MAASPSPSPHWSCRSADLPLATRQRRRLSQDGGQRGAARRAWWVARCRLGPWRSRRGLRLRLGERGAAGMDVFLMIRRHKTTIFTDAKESSTVYELKRIVEGILKRPPEEQRLYKDDQLLDDSKTLGDCGFTSQTARPQAPATVGLAFRAGDDSFEALRIDPFSSPPELPDVMKPQDSSSSANEQAVQ
ncbi:elongin-B [Emydura macquarii macquarii]|uniref:elongin-B n=1 Tax=Emydura macquarii macquarii TaxID=1129001 RepID=UPI00352B0033